MGSLKLTEMIGTSDVKAALVDALVLDDDAEITENTKLVDLGAIPIDLLGIFYKLGMDFSTYALGCSGEQLNKNAKGRLRKIGNSQASESTRAHFYALAESNGTDAFIKQIVVSDLIAIANYAKAHGDVE